MRDASDKGGRGPAASVVSFSAAISAYEKGGQWEQALSQLHMMCKADVTPNVISPSAATPGCVKGDQCQQSLGLFVSVAPVHVISHNAAISAGEQRAQCEQSHVFSHAGPFGDPKEAQEGCDEIGLYVLQKRLCTD